MESKKWVQHISGQGEKWEVDSFVHGVSWRVCRDGSAFYLPWKEYVDCDPPEGWEECTRKVVHLDIGGQRITFIPGGISISLVEHVMIASWKGDALVIEKRKS